MVIGFTGTQQGMNYKQRNSVLMYLRSIKFDEVHHGDCIGADQDFHHLVLRYFPEIRVIGHPPVIPAKRAFCIFSEERAPKPYLDRNRQIVAECDLLIACPKETTEQTRSGTWATVRYARQAKKQVQVFPPS